jgi:hypothetical protein
MRPGCWMDAEVAMAWCKFINLMEDHNAPADVMELLALIDHALLSEAVEQYLEDAAAARRARH